MTLIKEMFLNQFYGDIDEPELKITLIFFGSGYVLRNLAVPAVSTKVIEKIA